MGRLAPLLLLLAPHHLAVIGPAPPCRTAATPAPPTALPRGVVSVTSFGADPSGASDSTAALQRALIAARTQNVTLFVPLGCYVVTDTLNATEPRNGRWQPVVVVGQRPPAGKPPPTLRLPPRTAAFGDPHAPHPLLHFTTSKRGSPPPFSPAPLFEPLCESSPLSPLPSERKLAQTGASSRAPG